jgi:xanthine dehydrogenase accessory factor
VTLFFERHTHAEIDGDTYTRPTANADMPLSVRAHLRAVRSGATPNEPRLIDGWFVEPITPPRQPVWIYGAGHVGRALTTVLSALPFQITWIDVSRERFPADLPPHTDMFVAANPADAVRHAPDDAIHFVLTFSHAIDLDICQRVLNRPFKRLGLIGSATKRARFIKRLSAAGTDSLRLECPIGKRNLGKEPMAIAVGVASDLLSDQTASLYRDEEKTA